MDKGHILIVEDEKTQRTLLADFLRQEGYRVDEAGTGSDAIKIFIEQVIDIVLLDYRLPDTDGLTLLRQFKDRNPEAEIVMITAFGSIENAVSALKAGASEYLTKPVDLDDLLFKLGRIDEKRQLVRENTVLKETLKDRFRSENFIFSSDAMKEVASLIVRVAGTDSTCLIVGESGVGKEVVVNMIHELSERKKGPLVKVNSAAIPETLLESELFGYEKGAFTGAHQRKIGKFELANHGTIFLDEIGDIPLTLQAKLLRTIQEREIERLGGLRPIKVDVRILAATNRDLSEDTKQGKFREDLYYRLNVVNIVVPPLRERREDIPLLMDLFLKRFNDIHRRDVRGFTREARDIMIKHDYPGNVRELENIIERAVILTRGDYIGQEDIPFPLVQGQKENGRMMKNTVETVEQDMIMQALEQSGWIQTRAAALLGISERMLRYKIKKYDITRS